MVHEIVSLEFRITKPSFQHMY